MKTPQERAEEKRRQKLEEMQAQIREGSLVVRQMTPVYWTMTSWLLFTFGPVPLIRVLT